MQVTVTGGALPQEEIDQYVEHVKQKICPDVLTSLEITVDGEYVDLRWQCIPIKFQRIRRITGYLVGDMGRWNDAKTAEERDRVKHI